MTTPVFAGEKDLLEQKRAALRRHRAWATGLLLLAVLLFLLTQLVPEPGFAVLLLRAGAEAGIVGGLADWFAVTALFRRPLGLPIPHTGIIPRNKDRIGRGLGSFVERHCLAPDLIGAKLRSGNPALRLSGWLQRPANSRLIAEQIVAMLPEVTGSLQDREVRAFFRDSFGSQLSTVDLLPLLGRLLRLLQESGQHQRLLERGIELARALLLNNEEVIYEKVEQRSSWWVPRTIDRKIARAIAGAEELLAELENPEHPARQDFERYTADLIARLESSESFRRGVEELKARLLASAEMQQLLESAWDSLRQLLQERATGASERLVESLSASLMSLARTLELDEDAQERLNRRLEQLVSSFVVPFRAEIGVFIAEVVQSWDTRTVSERLELEVGRDLQYIRINGTLVGALAGCGLFLLTQLVF